MITYRSNKGSRLTSDEVDANFRELDQNGNRIVIDAGFSVVGQDITMSSGYEWKILGNDYTNASNVTISVPFASSGNQRIDLIVANTSNSFERIAGVESASNPALPSVLGKIVITTIDVTDGTIGSGSSTIVGADYVKKSFAQPYSYSESGANKSIPLHPLGYSEVRLTNSSLISISGFNVDLISGNPNAEVPFLRKKIFVKNLTGNDVVFKNGDSVNADIQLNIKGNTDVIVPNGEVIVFDYDPGGMDEFISKNI